MLQNNEIMDCFKTGQNLDFIQKPTKELEKIGSVIKVVIKENAQL